MNKKIEKPGNKKRKKRILFADDERHVREIMEEILTHLNYDIVTVEDGLSFYETFKEDKDGFDLLILDIIMPEMNGRDALLKVRKIAPEIPAILISGYTSEEMATNIMQIPKIKFLKKPFKIEQMKKVIKLMIEKEK